MNNLTTTNFNLGSLQLGDNLFETNVVTLAAGASLAEGDMLKRNAVTGKFEKVTDTGTESPVAIASVALSNPAAVTADIPCRPIVSGKVRAERVTVNGVVATKVQLDMIRRYDIIAIATTDLSKQDNQ